MIGHWGGLDPTPIFNLSLMLIAGPAITPSPEVGMTQIQTMWTMNGWETMTQSQVIKVLLPERGRMDAEQIKSQMSTIGGIGVMTNHMFLIEKL